MKSKQLKEYLEEVKNYCYQLRKL